MTIYGSAHAATIVVGSTGDPGGAGTCTLRQAIVSVNTGAVTGSCANSGEAFGSNDTIKFSNSLFSGGTPTITLEDAPGNSLHVDDAVLAIDAGEGRNVVVQRPSNAQNKFPVVTVGRGDYLHLTGLTVQNGFATYVSAFTKYNIFSKFDAGGGGIQAPTAGIRLDRCTIRNNFAYDYGAQHPGQDYYTGGGGISAGFLIMNSSLVAGNTAGGARGVGGGVFISGAGGPATPGLLRMSNSTISGNTVESFVGGAAIAAWAKYDSVGIRNSTISGNLSPRAIKGGTIAINGILGKSYLLDSTLACNNTSSDSSVVYAVGIKSGGLGVISTIFADTNNAACATTTSNEFGVAAGGPIVLKGDHNLIVANSAIGGSVSLPGDTVFGDPQLGPLQNNGGLTPTHALGAYSPAIDAGSNPAGFGYDQRGAPFGRFVGKAPDIGAYESATSHLCGSAWGKNFVTLGSSTPNLCNSGAYLQNDQVFGSGPWAWFCAANTDPSHNEFCGAKVKANASVLIETAQGAVVSSAIYGQPLRLKAAVEDSRSPAQAVPTGSVSFFDASSGGFVPVCVGSALSGGETICDTTDTPIDIGVRQIKIVYNGDGSFGEAAGIPGTVTINPAGSTTTIVSQSPNPVYTRSSFTVVAQVSANTPSVATPTGTVKITDQTDNLSCSYDLAQTTPGCALRPVSAGPHALLVTYQGNGNVAASSTTGTQQAVVPSDRIFADGFGN